MNTYQCVGNSQWKVIPIKRHFARLIFGIIKRLNFLLVTFCSLLVTFCSLLLIFCSFLLTLCSLLFACCSLLFARCLLFFRPNYYEIKLLWTAKKWFDNSETPPDIFSLQIFSTCKIIFKVDIKSQLLPELISLWYLYHNIWTRFSLLLCSWKKKCS